MAPWLGAPPSKNLEACSHMLLDGATAMPQGNVEADEGCHKVWAEILLQTGLLYPHPFPTEAKEQPDGAKEVLPRNLLQGGPLPIQLNGCCGPCLELCQLLIHHNSLGKMRLEQCQGVPLPWSWP